MRAKQFITEGLAQNKAKMIISKFIEFCQENLELDQLPEIELHFNSDRSVENKSFGGYGGRHIILTVSNRHVMDVCRTLAHELVHFKQDLDNQLEDPDAGSTGSPQENEANAKAAVIMRNWGKLHPKLFAQQAVE